MSGPERPQPAPESAHSLKRKNLSQDDQDDVAELDRVFKRIKKAAPRVPYVLSAPSLDPYRYHSRQEANAWMMGHLFRPDEEHLQYQTYVYREPCEDCLELRAGEDYDPEPERPDSRASSTGQVAKKKLNLANFKVRQVNGTATPGSKKPSPTLAPTKAVPGQVNGAKKPEKHEAAQQKAKPSSSPRSSQPEFDDHSATQAGHESNDRPTRPRPRSPLRQTASTDVATTIDKSDTSDKTPHGLPPILSPVHEHPSNPYGLPNILSPTLPLNITEELEKLTAQHKRAESNTSTSPSEQKSQLLAVPGSYADRLIDKAKSEPKIRTVTVAGKSPSGDVDRRKDNAAPSLIFKIKIPKHRASSTNQLLKFAPKKWTAEKMEQFGLKKAAARLRLQVPTEEPKKKKPIPKVAARRSHDTPPLSTPSTKPTSTPSAKPTSTPMPAAKPAEKRPRTDDDVASAAPSKRPKASSSQDRPHTPTSQAIPSPSLSNKSSAQKGQYATPKSSLKAAGMLRTESAESHDSMPGRSAATPTGVKADAKSGPTSAPMSSKKQADISLLAQTSMKLNQMGRALKHEATKILTGAGAGKQVTKQDEKRAAVTNMECILSYMAAYYAQDASLNLRGRPGEVEQTWKTLLPLCVSYSRSTKDLKHLDGLRSYLSSVIASAICTHISQRVPIPRPHDSPQDMPHANLAKQHALVASNFSLLSDHTLKMNMHYQEARVALPFEDIQNTYKKTYAARETNAKIAKDTEKTTGANLSGPFFLPLAIDSTPIQAVRFGLVFLAEYVEREGLEYAFRVNLDRVE